MNYYTADLHFYHGKVIELERRPFANVNTMNQGLISRWNKTVKNDDDDVWVAGDLAFNKHCDVVKEILSKLRGRKHLVLGNHDEQFREWTWMKIGFSSVHTVVKVVDEGEEIWLAHKPDAREKWNLPKGCTLFHGHLHARESEFIKPTKNGWDINVGVDCHDFKPITMADVHKLVNDKIIRGF